MKKWARPTRKFISILGSANESGGRLAGCAKAPEVLHYSKFMDNIKLPLHWERVIEEPKSLGNLSNPISNVIGHSKELAKRTKKAILCNNELLVLGGDHSCAIGTWSGIGAAFQEQGSLGLIWIDAHLDAHTVETTPTGNLHGTPVAHLLGYGNKNLAGLYGIRPKIQPRNFVIVGARSFEREEHDLLKQLQVKIFYMDDVKKRGCQEVMVEAIEISTAGTRGFGMSIDLDAFDPKDCPAVSTPEKDGISTADFLDAIKKINLSKLIATEIAEFLPDSDSKDKKTEQFIAALIREIYTRKWEHRKE